MKQVLNFFKLSKAVQHKRVDLGIDIRTAAKQIGTSAATLSRIENESMPDLITYANTCKWLKVSLDTFITKEKKITLE